MPVTEANIGATINETPYIMQDHMIYWASDATGTLDMYRATWNGSSFRSPERITGIDVVDNNLKTSPVVTPDELTLHFQSARAGSVGTYDIWMATRTSTVAAFGMPMNLSILNGSENDIPSWISADNCLLYFTRNVGGSGPTDYDLFFAVRGK